MQNLTHCLAAVFAFMAFAVPPVWGDTQEKPQAIKASVTLLSDIKFKGYFEDVDHAVMGKVCESGETEECIREIERVLKKESDPDQSIRMRFVLGLNAHSVKDYKKSFAAFSSIEGKYPLFGDYIHYYMGENAYFMSEWDNARSHFVKVPEDSRLYLQAKFRAASCAAKTKAPEAIDKLEELLEKHPDHFRGAQTRFELAELIARINRKKARKLYIDVQTSEPGTGYGKMAEKRFAALKLRALSKTERAKLKAAQGKVLIRRFQYKAAGDLLREEYKTYPERDISANKGKILYQIARSDFKRRRYKKAIINFEDILKTKVDKKTKGLALCGEIDALLRKGEEEKAVKACKRFLRVFPRHEKAHTVRYYLGKAYKELNQHEKAIEAFSNLLKYNPEGKKTADSMWYLGWLHYRRNQLGPAKEHLKKIFINSSSRFEKERALYWLGKIWLKLDLHKEAVGTFNLLVQDFPLSYYSGLAAQRLKELNLSPPKDYLDKTNLSGFDKASDLKTDISRYIKHPHCIKGIEMLRLGRCGEARREFHELEKAFPDDETPDILLAYLYHISGNIHRSISLFRTRLKHFAWTYPGKTNRSMWVLAYPIPFKEIVEMHTEKVGLDKFLLFALMREESSFQADVVSYAGAVGLTQIIRATGRKIALQIGKNGHKLNDLTDPDVSIRFGSFHMKDLINRFNGNHALAISSYNAGEGAVKRWLEKFGELPMDEFIEEIPYTQTRRYTRRVLKSYGIYRYLYTDGETGFDLWRKSNSR